MKNRVMLFIVIVIALFSLSGCGGIDANQMIEIKPPRNNNLCIRGKWQITNYKILDKNIYTDNVESLKGKIINIGNRKIRIDDKKYDGVDYKLKVVKDDYYISYQAGFTIKDLGIHNEDVDIITANDKNNIIFDFFHIDDNKSYIYYQGVFLTVKKVGDVFEESFKNTNEKLKNSHTHIEKVKTDLGLYLAFKQPRQQKEDGTYIDENYKTLWISYKQGKLQKIEEADGIIFPRMSGIWTLEKRVLNKDNKHQEYFVANTIDRKGKEDSVILNSDKDIYRSINFISNDYISTEKYEGNNFKNKFSQYEILPIDNLSTEKAIVIQDIYSKNTNLIYKRDFENSYEKLTDKEKSLSKNYIEYSNFTMKRENGKWVLQGKISPSNVDDDSYNYNLSITPNDSLIKYDTLVIPWRVLKNKVPFIEDAYISPGGNLAIIIINGEVLIYEIKNNTLSEKPLERYDIKKGEQVIMAEWCENVYVDYWGNSFKEFQKKSK